MNYTINTGGIIPAKVEVNHLSVTIRNSADIDSCDLQTEACKQIKALPDIPDCIKARSCASLVNEWRAHNFLYRLPLLPSGWRERLRVVDLDAEPLLRRAAYLILAMYGK